MLRRTLQTRTTRFRALSRSLFPSILCFCEGRRRAFSGNRGGFPLLVRQGNRLYAGDPLSKRCYAFTMGRTSHVMGTPGR